LLIICIQKFYDNFLRTGSISILHIDILHGILAPALSVILYLSIAAWGLWRKLTNFLPKILVVSIKITWKLFFHTLFASKRLHLNAYI